MSSFFVFYLSLLHHNNEMFRLGKYPVEQPVDKPPNPEAELGYRHHQMGAQQQFVAHKTHLDDVGRKRRHHALHLLLVERVQMCIVGCFAVTVYAKRIGYSLLVGSGDNKDAAGLEFREQRVNKALGVNCMLDDFGCDDAIENMVGKGQVVGICHHGGMVVIQIL